MVTRTIWVGHPVIKVVVDSLAYEVLMKQRHAALKVMDPTKLLKIVMRNPRTGFSL